MVCFLFEFVETLSKRVPSYIFFFLFHWLHQSWWSNGLNNFHQFNIFIKYSSQSIEHCHRSCMFHMHIERRNVCTATGSSKAWRKLTVSTNIHDWFFTFLLLSFAAREKLFSRLQHLHHLVYITYESYLHSCENDTFRTIKDDRNLMSFHSLLFWMWTKISGDKCTSLLKKMLNQLEFKLHTSYTASNILYLKKDKFPFTCVQSECTHGSVVCAHSHSHSMLWLQHNFHRCCNICERWKHICSHEGSFRSRSTCYETKK